VLSTNYGNKITNYGNKIFEVVVTCQDDSMEKNKAESKFVITEGHVEENPYHTALRRTNRIMRRNVYLRDFAE